MKKHVILLLVVALVGCGQRGPLFMPPQEQQNNSPEETDMTPQNEQREAASEDTDQSS